MDTKNKHSEINILVEQYYVKLHEFAFRLLSCDETAKDIVQDVFVKLIEQSEGKNPPKIASIKTYLYTMVKNNCLNHLHRKNLFDNYQDQIAPDAFEDGFILESLIYSEVIHDLRVAVDILPPSCQNICKLAYFDELKNAEIAEISGLSVNTVKTQKKRALQLLREKLLPIVKSLNIFF